MFAGHYAVGFALKTKFPKLSLGIYFFTVNFLDFLAPLFNIIGIETTILKENATSMADPYIMNIPWSHGLISAFLWSLIVGFIFKNIMKLNYKLMVVISFAVFSHYILDIVSHSSLPISYGLNQTIGFGLGKNLLAHLILELIILSVCVIPYLIYTKSKNILGNISILGLIITFVGMMIAILGANPIAPTKIFSLITLLLFSIYTGVGFLIDNNRVMKSP